MGFVTDFEHKVPGLLVLLPQPLPGTQRTLRDQLGPSSSRQPQAPCRGPWGRAARRLTLYQREVRVVLIDFAAEDGEGLALQQHGFLLKAREQF